jgi:hypothetical protein
VPQGVQVRVLFPAPVMTKTPWSRNQKIAVWGVCIPIILAVLSLFSPEVRRLVGLEKPIAPSTPLARIETPPSSPPQILPTVPNPKPSNGRTAQQAKAKVRGNHNVAGNNVNGSENVVGDNDHITASQVQISAPNGIAIDGGIVTNPTVNNFGPPPLPTPTVTVCVSHPAVPEGAQHLTILTFRTDVEIMEPWYVLLFDGPVSDGTAEMSHSTFGYTHGKADRIPNPENSFLFRLTSIDFGVPRWLPNNELKLTVPSKDPVNLVKWLSGSGEEGRDEKFVFRCD